MLPSSWKSSHAARQPTELTAQHLYVGSVWRSGGRQRRPWTSSKWRSSSPRLVQSDQLITSESPSQHDSEIEEAVLSKQLNLSPLAELSSRLSLNAWLDPMGAPEVLPLQKRKLTPSENHVAGHTGSETAIAQVGNHICLALKSYQVGQRRTSLVRGA